MQSCDHGVMCWATRGPLLMVTNEQLCGEETRKMEFSTVPAEGQCVDYQAARLFDAHVIKCETLSVFFNI